MYLEDKKQKQNAKRKQAASLNVKISTPVSKQLSKAKKKKVGLLFGVSPIRLEACGSSNENNELSKSLFERVRQRRLKEMAEEEALETSVVRSTKALLQEFKQRRNMEPLQRSSIENLQAPRMMTLKELQDIDIDAEEPREKSLTMYKRNRRTKATNGRKLKAPAIIVDDLKDNNEKSLAVMQVSFPLIHVTTPEKLVKTAENSMESPTKFFGQSYTAEQEVDGTMVKTDVCASEQSQVSTRVSLKKSVGFAVPLSPGLADSTIKRVSLKPGKWRRSLIHWRKSQNDANNTERRTTVIMEEEECEYFFVTLCSSKIWLVSCAPYNKLPHSVVSPRKILLRKFSFCLKNRY